jgi:hypothetical protein
MTEGVHRPAPVGAIDGAHIRTFLIADVRGYTVFTQEHGDEAHRRRVPPIPAPAERLRVKGGLSAVTG